MDSVLAQTTHQLLIKGKGILASDESIPSADKNLAKINVKGTKANRQRYRELFINTPTFEKYVNGMIISDETFWQTDTTTKPFRETLQEKDIAIIIKVDRGTHEFPASSDSLEKITLGLDEFETRLPAYFEAGARAAKWRSVFNISDSTPSESLIDANSTSLALYALYCQKNGIVPIVEPEVLYEGDHSISTAQEITTKVNKAVFEKLTEYKVDLNHTIIKSSMVLAGKSASTPSTPEEVAHATVETFKASVPQEIPGIVFLSGGQTPDQATENLNAIAQENAFPKPRGTDWPMTFSFLRAIEGPAGQVWAGKDENVNAAREVFLKQLKKNSMASQGLL